MSTILTPKIIALFRAVNDLMLEGADINGITVSQITVRAGIGKGTAYEYFTNKEELIAGALLYKLSNICQEVQEEMETRSSLRDKVSYLLDAIDQKEREKTYLLKVVNIVTDASPLSRQIESIMKSEAYSIYMPENILDYLLECAVKERGESAAVPTAYTKLNVAAKMLTYTMYSLSPKEQWDCEPEVMYRLVCDSICDELGC